MSQHSAQHQNVHVAPREVKQHRLLVAFSRTSSSEITPRSKRCRARSSVCCREARVRDAIAKLDFMSFYGQIKFDERGINVNKPMAVEQWQNGRRVTVWPSDVAEVKAQWPMPAWSAR